jgi:glycosyltransferase involved in cell wall biosynthesis
VRVAVVVGGGVPNPVTGGGALTAWTVLHQLAADGHEPTVCVLHDPDYYDPTSSDLSRRVHALEELGIGAVPILSRSTGVVRSAKRDLVSRVRRALQPAEIDLYPHGADRAAVAGVLAELDPDTVFAYHWEAVAATSGLTLPRLAAVGDPSHLPTIARWRDGLPEPAALRQTIRVQAAARGYPPLMVRLLNECSASGAFAAHHAGWLRRKGASACRYLRTPVPDPGRDSWQSTRAPGDSERKPRILLLGHLGGIVTINGLRNLAAMLPALEQALGETGFEVRIVGGYDPPDDLRRALSRPSVRFFGHTEDVSDELAQATVLLVPNSISLGIRVRIVTGWAHGCCVVSHAANARGIPELEHEQNALLSTTVRGLTDEVLRAVGAPELRHRMEAGGRDVYERWFRPEVAGGEIVRLLEQLADGRDLAKASLHG